MIMSPTPTRATPDAAAGSGLAFSRRSLLRAGGLTSLAALLGGLPGLTTAATAGAAPSAPPPSSPAQVRPSATPRAGVGDAVLTQPLPYSVTASCELSEDYFLTDQVILSDADDLVLPFAGTDGTVEAIVLAGGLLSHLRRDPTQPSGWTYTTIPTFEGWTVINASVITDATGRTILLYERSWQAGSNSTTVVQLTLDPDTGAWKEGLNETNRWPISKIQGGLDPNGQPYFALFGTAGQLGVFFYNSDNVEHLPIFEFIPINAPTIANPAQSLLLWDSALTGSSSGWLVTLDDSGVLNAYVQTSPEEFSTTATAITPNGSGSVATLVWAGRPGTTNQPVPDVVFQNTAGNLFITNSTAVTSVQVDLGDTPGIGHAATWQDDDTYSFAYLNAEGLVSIITGYLDDSQQAFTAPIPLEPGYARIYAQPTDPAQGTIFAVDADLSLNILAKDPLSGSWSLVPVHQQSEQALEIASWRTQLRVVDANGNGVAGAQLQLTADQLIGIWQPTGNAFLDDKPLTVTTDGWGLITFSIPAVELDTAGITAQALGPDGTPTGAALAVAPDIDVHQFLAGNGSLTDLGQLDGPTLLAATNNDGSPLLPNLTTLPSSQQADAATSVTGALTHASALGFGFVPTTASDPQAAQFDLTGAAPSFQTSTDPNAFNDLMAIEGISDWWNSVKHDAKSAYHGLRHGALALKKMVTTWADDVKQWTINLIVDIGNGVQQLMNWVIDGVEDAIHAISSFFHALGGDITKAWDWLKHHVLDLLKETGANAKVMEGWLDQAGSEFATLITELDTFVDGYFTGLETKAHAAISALAQDFEQLTFGQSAPIPPPSSSASSSDSDALGKGLAEFGKIMHYASGSWLWDKIKSYLPHSDTGGGPAADPVCRALASDALTVITAQVDALVDFGKLIATTLADLTSTSSMTEQTIAAFFTKLDALVHDMLVLADALVNTALGVVKAVFDALENVLDYELAAIPFLGQLFKLAGIDPTLSVKHLVCLLAAFPATLVNGILNKGNPLFPSSEVGEVHGAPADPWGAGLNTGAFAVQLIWTFVDEYEDLKAGDDARSVPDWCNYVDNIAPVLLAVLAWPGKPVDDKTQPPFSDRDTGGPDGAMITWYQLLGVASPALALFIWLGGVTADEEAAEPYTNYFLPGANAVIGIGCIVLTSLWNWATSQNTNSKAIGVMGELSYVCAPLGIKEVGEASDGGSYLVKLVVDTVGNFGTAIAFVDAATSA